MAIKRPHYFDHQFLIEADFTLEQNYHLDMRRRLNRGLHTFGIAEGLRVTKTASRSVTIEAGMAIDSQGREIVLDAPRLVEGITAPAGTRVFITAAYRETETDLSTTTGAAGNTRFTEEPIIVFVIAPPPTDGSVIRLATFDMDGGANVPGNIGDFLDGGVRVPAGAKGALRSINNVTNPGGNLSILGGQSIIVTADDVNDRITIGENHSTRTDNPHATTAAQIGAMLSTEYDLRRRASASIGFATANVDGATQTANFGFQPRVVIVAGTCTANLSGRAYSGGISAWAFLDPPTSAGIIIQRCFGFGVTRFSNTDWLFRSLSATNIMTANIQDNGVAPSQAELLNVQLSSFTSVGLVATFNRAVIPGASPLSSFNITLHLLVMGA